MRALPRLLKAVAFSLSAFVLTACGDSQEDVATETGAIKGSGAYEADDYLFAALVNGDRGQCSGAVIAPRVVLTAGHCVGGFSNWNIKAPFAGKQATGTEGAVFDYVTDLEGKRDHNREHDVGLIFLTSEQAIDLPSYPSLATGPLARGAKPVAVGRKRDGVLSNYTLFASRGLSLKPSSLGRFDYTTSDVVEPGDSGGPVVATGASYEDVIVAVNASHREGFDAFFARVDLVRPWIDAQVDAHGGYAK